MKVKLIILLSTMVLGFVFTVPTQAAFEILGNGPRPVSMGGAFTALADDANAIWFNPSGIAQLQQRQVMTMYARLFPGMDFDKLHNFLLGYVQPIGSFGALGVGWCGLKADVYSENVISVAYAKGWRDRLYVGVTGKWLQWGADSYVDAITGVSDQDFSNSSIAFDVGALYNVGTFFNYATIKAGAAVLNVNEPNISQSGVDSGKIPRTLRAGLLFDTKNYLVEADILRYGDLTKFLFGVELKTAGPYDLRVRTGAIQIAGDNEGGEYDGGFGFTVKGISFDYAFLYPTQIKKIGGSHRFSLTYEF